MRCVRLRFPRSKSSRDGLELLHEGVVVEADISESGADGKLADAFAGLGFEGCQFFLEGVHLGELFGAAFGYGLSGHEAPRGGGCLIGASTTLEE